MVLSKKELQWVQRYWTTTNYLAAASVYLKDNFLLERKLKPDDIKDSLLGHWGTCPGLNFIYTHLNLLAVKERQEMLLLTGPGHGFAAILANQYLEGSLGEYYPDMTHDKLGLGRMIKRFCWPGGFPSHLNPGVPGCIHEGGELGYALGTAFGAALDNPDLLVVAIVGDGEAETGPTATAWHSTKYLNPRRDGAVLPIVHINGYKISSRTIYGSMDDSELRSLFHGYGYDPIFVGTSHLDMHHAIMGAHAKIKTIQNAARSGEDIEKPRWPVILLRTPKGWTGIKRIDGKPIEGSFRSHQVPAKDAKTSPEHLKQLEDWLKSYDPKELFPGGLIPPETLAFVPTGELRIGNNKHAIGGNIRQPLRLPDPRQFEIKMSKRGHELAGSTPLLGKYLKQVYILNADRHNFRIFSPDELASNKLDAVLDITDRVFMWPHGKEDGGVSKDGRVMEMLSEHTLQSWLQGYNLTGRHGLFPSYEAFLPIVDSMVSQYLKFIQLSQEHPWRKPVPALNYLLTSVCWRQDHNGFSHQNPGFINTILNKAREEKLVRVYLPPDANSLIAVADHCLRTTNRVNVIVSDKQLIRQWLTYEEAVSQCKTGASVWRFASDDDPDVVIAACGDYQTQEGLAAIQLLKQHIPELRVRFVNVSELNVLGHDTYYANSMDETIFNDIFTPDKEVIFTYHGYPGAIKQLLFDRGASAQRFHVYGYIENGTTTTPFDMFIRNNVSRYHLAMRAVRHAAKRNADVASAMDVLLATFEAKILEHRKYVLTHGKDPDEITNWSWK
jgi:xylulose-5-phosphate/fructose-6-phosphate phosphoketolase